MLIIFINWTYLHCLQNLLANNVGKFTIDGVLFYNPSEGIIIVYTILGYILAAYDI